MSISVISPNNINAVKRSMEYLDRIIARIATYFQPPVYAELLLLANGSYIQSLETFRADSVVSNMPDGIDNVATCE